MNESDRRSTVPARSDVALMAGYHSAQVDVAVRLNTNEAPEPPPDAFANALAQAVTSQAYNRYPSREAWTLREAIGRHHDVAPQRVYAANGSNEVIQSILLAYGGHRRASIVFEPTYALHSHISRVTGTPVIEGERDAAFLVERNEVLRTLEAARVLSEMDGPPVVFLCSPNNPSGRVEPFELIEEVLELAPGLVIVDEAYGQFAPRSALELLDDYPHLVVLRTFSKTWSLAALRLGYAVASEEIVQTLGEVTLPYHLDAMKQVAGVTALQFDAEMRDRVDRIVAERDRITAGLTALGLSFVPSDANFILFEVGDRDAHAIWQRLVDASVLVRDVSDWPRLSGYLRVTVGTSTENDRFLLGLERALR